VFLDRYLAEEGGTLWFIRLSSSGEADKTLPGIEKIIPVRVLSASLRGKGVVRGFIIAKWLSYTPLVL